ncbi:hypothetical protein P3W85_04195 [Cupriavidus basilensis]|uniref:Uncharacterized protein n=1 Tax=Cupriavidus basilensis TaxID=68895 RepID=A0ABT6AHS6_9BURK|nr:hypothetical protein [Cupriavidus basilensis]MDF3832155.1 hypothetical protein [Cupriavidus basilensis]
MKAFDIKQFIAAQAAAVEVSQQHMGHMQKVPQEQLADILETSTIESTMDAGFAIVHRIRLHHGQGQQALAISTAYGNGDCYLMHTSL